MAEIGGRLITVDDLVKDSRVVIEHSSRHYLSLTFEGMGKVYWEILRADLNGDGIEDILLSTYSYAIGGTLGFGGITIVTKTSTGSKFEILSDAHLCP